MIVRFDKWQALFDDDLFLASFIARMADMPVCARPGVRESKRPPRLGETGQRG